MNVEENVYAVLSADAGVLALVPSNRILPPGNWTDVPRPYIIHFPVAVSSTYTHDKGLANLKMWRNYQVSCFANAYSTAKALAVAVRNALGNQRGGITCMWTGERPLPYELDVRVSHIAVEFEIADTL